MGLFVEGVAAAFALTADPPIRVVVEGGQGGGLLTDPAFWAVGVSLFVGALAAWEAHRRAAVERAAQRRTELATRFGDALADALAWRELPYRIARRTSDDADVLAGLAERFHALQERIDHRQRWLQLDAPPVGDAYAALVGALKSRSAPLISAAYARDPVTTPEGMVLGDASFVLDVDAECGAFVSAVERHLHKVTAVRLFGRRGA